jgi:prenyltransferase beta subunit
MCQSSDVNCGGFMKYEFLNKQPDILHTLYSVASLALCNSTKVEKFNPLLAICQ